MTRVRKLTRAHEAGLGVRPRGIARDAGCLESAPLTAQEEQGIRGALDALDAGRGIPFDDVMSELEGDVGDS